MEDALLYMVYRATDPAKVSAMQLNPLVSLHCGHAANDIITA